MRVLFLSASGGLGGSERVLLEIAAALRRAEPAWALGLAAVQQGPLLELAAGLGLDTFVEPLPERFARVGESGRSTPRVMAGLALSAVPLGTYRHRLAQRISTWGPDVVHSHALKTHVLGAWTTPRSARLVWHLHDYLSDRRVSARLMRRYANLPATILANSLSVAADVQRVCGREVQTIYNTVDLERFTPEGAAADLDLASGLAPPPPATVRIGLVATFARWKGHGVFLDAIAALGTHRPVRGYVIGGPIYQTGGSQVSRDELRAAAARRGLSDHVGFTGFLHDTGPALRALDVVVHASTRPEPFGLVVAEAMACGRAVVVSAAGGAAELVTHGEDALTYAPGDVSALTSNLERLLDPVLRLRLGREARARAEHRFSRTRLADELRVAYARALVAA